MVAKKSRITAKPQQPKPEDIDAFLGNLGTDPEATQKPPEASTPRPTEPTTENDKGKKKTFPHRLSADFDKDQYKRLKRAAFETEIPMTEILRKATEDWLKARGY